MSKHIHKWIVGIFTMSLMIPLISAGTFNIFNHHDGTCNSVCSDEGGSCQSIGLNAATDDGLIQRWHPLFLCFTGVGNCLSNINVDSGKCAKTTKWTFCKCKDTCDYTGGNHTFDARHECVLNYDIKINSTAYVELINNGSLTINGSILSGYEVFYQRNATQNVIKIVNGGQLRRR